MLLRLSVTIRAPFSPLTAFLSRHSMQRNPQGRMGFWRIPEQNFE